jgi:hypothetical protein
MITLTAAALDVLTRSHRRYLAVESWWGGQLLASDIPVESGSEETDRSLAVPERVTLTVPRLDRGASWSPTTEDHPLAANGQRLRISIGVGLVSGDVEWITRGWFLVEDADTDGDAVKVTASGLLSLIREARLVSPYQPSGTLVSTLRGLIEPALTVQVSGGLTDRSVPTGINMDEDRLSAVLALLDAWPADATVTPDGVLKAVPAVQSTTPVLTLTDAAGGTVIRATGSSTRDGAYNCVVAKGEASDGGQVIGTAYYSGTGPRRMGGPFNPLPVPYFYSSPLLTSIDQANDAAQTILDRIRRRTAREYTVTCVPHPAIQAGDVVRVTHGGITELCTVESLTLPLAATGGDQRLTVRTLDA